MSNRKRILLAIAALLLLALALMAWSGLRTAAEARAALAALDRLQAAAGAPDMAALEAMAGDVAALEQHLTAARSAARPFLLAAPAFGWLPQVGPLAQAAPTLADMAVEATAGGRQAVEAVLPALQGFQRQGGADGLGQVVTALRAAGPELAAADARLARAQELHSTLNVVLPDRLQSQLDQVDRLLPLARAALQGAQAAPALLGADGPRTYLILAQNSDEMRATGGFISAVGVVRFENGRIADLKLTDSYAVDDFSQPHPLPPGALAEQMGAQLLVLRDSNWSPDFPTSAEVARALYAQDQGVETDGAIALDLEAVRLLVEALGSLNVAGIEEPVTADTVLPAMKRAWEAPQAAGGTVEEAQTSDWWARRKDFMGDLVSAALARLQSGADLNPAALARALLTMLDGRHLQVSVDDPAVAALLAEQSWDGGLRPVAGQDFLAVIDSNVGFNKASAAVRSELDYRLRNEEGQLKATLTVTYTHGAAPLPAEEICDRTPRYGASYNEMVRRCYWNYVRVYAPADSELIEAKGIERPATEPGERNTTVFAGAFSLRPGEQHVVRLVYRPGPSVSLLPYALTVRKQAGAPPWPLHVDVGRCKWDDWLYTDRFFECPAGVE